MAGTGGTLGDALAQYEITRSDAILSADDAIKAIHAALLIAVYGKVRPEDVKLGRTLAERSKGERVNVPADIMLSSRARYSCTRLPIRPMISASAPRSQVANAAVASAYGLLKRAKNGDPSGTWVVVGWRIKLVHVTQAAAVIGSANDLQELAARLRSDTTIPAEVATAVQSDPTLATIATFGDLKNVRPEQDTLVDKLTSEPAVQIELACVDITGGDEPARFLEKEARSTTLVPKRATKAWYAAARNVIVEFHKVAQIREPVLSESNAARAQRLLKIFAKDDPLQRQRALEAAFRVPYADIAADIEHYFGEAKALTKEELAKAKAMAADGFDRSAIAEVLVVRPASLPNELFATKEA